MIAEWDLDNNSYRSKRRDEFPRIEDQLDYIYHNGIDKWKTDIVDPVKNKYPKTRIKWQLQKLGK